MRILVTGGAGFIGSHIVEELLNLNHEVHVIDNLVSGFRHNIPNRAIFFETDIASKDCERIILQYKYDAIVHLAAQIDVRKSVSDPVFDAQVNILGTLNLLNASTQVGVKRFVFASSGGTVYGEQIEFPASEMHRIMPISPYGVSKATVEHYLYYYSQIRQLPYVSLRYGNVFGPRQNPHGEAGVVAIFIQKMLNGQTPTINGEGLQTRDYVYVKDVVSANIKALFSNRVGCYNIGTGVETTVNHIFDTINQILGNKFNRFHGPAKTGEQQRSVLDCLAAKKYLDWIPQYEFSKGIAETIEWFSTNKS